MLGSASSIEPEHKENEHSSREVMRTLPPPETFLTVPHSSLDGSGPIAARIAARNAARLQAVRDVTFEQCADELMASHETAWRNLKHRAQRRATLATYAYPIFGNLPVSEIDTPLLMKVLLPIWTTTPETASRVRQRIGRVLRFATVIGYPEGENPARWRGHLQGASTGARLGASGPTPCGN